VADVSDDKTMTDDEATKHREATAQTS